MKPVIHRQCPACDWWQVRAETDTGFMYTPCEQHAPNQYGRPVLKSDVIIRDRAMRELLDQFEVKTFPSIHPTTVAKCSFCNEIVQMYTPATRITDSPGNRLLFHPKCVVPFVKRILKELK